MGRTRCLTTASGRISKTCSSRGEAGGAALFLEITQDMSKTGSQEQEVSGLWIVSHLSLLCPSLPVQPLSLPLTTWSCLVPDMQGTYHHCGTPMTTHQDITTMTMRKISTGQGHTSTTMTARTTFHLAHTIHPMNHIGLKLVHLGALGMVITLKIGMAMAMISPPTMTCHCVTTIAITSMTMPTVAALMSWEDGSITTGHLTLSTPETAGQPVLLSAES